jgi:hypothetical protein
MTHRLLTRTFLVSLVGIASAVGVAIRFSFAVQDAIQLAGIFSAFIGGVTTIVLALAGRSAAQGLGAALRKEKKDA